MGHIKKTAVQIIIELEETELRNLRDSRFIDYVAIHNQQTRIEMLNRIKVCDEKDQLIEAYKRGAIWFSSDEFSSTKLDSESEKWYNRKYGKV